jgi:DNA-3-methyladenine glycosylase
VPLAEALLGKTLIHIKDGVAAGGIIVETEAYAGREDPACHSYMRTRTNNPSSRHRTDVMFGPGGYAYVYLIYGMYNCFNVVANMEDEPEAVLVRALEPSQGLAIMGERRKAQTVNVKKLCDGPGKLCMALGITRECYGADLCGDVLFITEGAPVPQERILATPRINVDYAARLPYRFVVRDSDFLSTRRGLGTKTPGRSSYSDEDGAHSES